MTDPNDTEMRVYDQLMKVRRCINALKDVAENIPEDERYCAVLGIVFERLDSEFTNLFPMALCATAVDERVNEHEVVALINE